MKYRAVANGNVVDDVHESLVTAGIYVRVDEDEGRPERVVEVAAAEPAQEPVEPRTTAVAPLTTDDAPLKPEAPARLRGRPPKGR